MKTSLFKNRQLIIVLLLSIINRSWVKTNITRKEQQQSEIGFIIPVPESGKTKQIQLLIDTNHVSKTRSFIGFTCKKLCSSNAL